eukprot:TRINITY_DN2626_c0_g1_i4.p1 TRINITY_DN2626_c0_g1~~TRINITY_DN2626_c0_g1_i4.p1  ORF type:complete len:449 (-),score=120.76 TRINITY_DN2626_c0_g1_i4:1504-2850(-)
MREDKKKDSEEDDFIWQYENLTLAISSRLSQTGEDLITSSPVSAAQDSVASLPQSSKSKQPPVRPSKPPPATAKRGLPIPPSTPSNPSTPPPTAEKKPSAPATQYTGHFSALQCKPPSPRASPSLAAALSPSLYNNTVASPATSSTTTTTTEVREMKEKERMVRLSKRWNLPLQLNFDSDDFENNSEPAVQSPSLKNLVDKIERSEAHRRRAFSAAGSKYATTSSVVSVEEESNKFNQVAQLAIRPHPRTFKGIKTPFEGPTNTDNKKESTTPPQELKFVVAEKPKSSLKDLIDQQASKRPSKKPAAPQFSSQPQQVKREPINNSSTQTAISKPATPEEASIIKVQALVRRFLVRRYKRRLKVAIELLKTERNYVSKLKIIVEIFYLPLKKSRFLKKEESEVIMPILQHVEQIYNSHLLFLALLREEDAIYNHRTLAQVFTSKVFLIR